MKSILLVIVIEALLFMVAYLIDNYYRAKKVEIHKAQRQSIIIGIIASVPAFLLYGLWRVVFFSDDDPKGIPLNFPIHDGKVFLLFIVGTPLVLYVTLFLVSRRLLFK